jgi:hypothetical protein
VTPTLSRAEQLRQAEIAVAQEMARRAAAASFREFLHYWHFENRDTGLIQTFLPCLHAELGHKEHIDSLWPGQEEFIAAMGEHPYIFALKAGKLGFTELECAFDVWVALFGPPNARVHVFSMRDDASQEVLKWIRFGLIHLPAFLRPQLLSRPSDSPQDVKTQGDTLHRLQFEGRQWLPPEKRTDDLRTIVSYPAGAHVSVDQVCQHAHVDELAKMPFPQRTWPAVRSTIAPTGSCHIVTRGAGDDNFVAELWRQIEDGSGQMYPFFQPWTARPDRDEAWREEEGRELTAQQLAHYLPETVADALAGDAQSAYIPEQLYDACKEELPSFDPEKVGLAGTKEPVVLAADAGVSNDCFGIVAVTRHPHPSRHADVAIRAIRLWEPPKGGHIDFAEPEKFIREICRLYNVVQLAYDPYQLESMMQGLTRDAVVWCEPFNQQKDRLIADSELRDLIVNRRLAHDGNRSLREHFLNAAAKLQAKEDSQIRIIKKAPHRKVDLAVATSMACNRCLYLLL